MASFGGCVMKELKILAPCGILGYGYPESSPINKADKNILEENSAVNWIWKMAHQEKW